MGITYKYVDFAVTEIAPQSECVGKSLISVETGGKKFTADMKVLYFNLAQKIVLETSPILFTVLRAY